MYEIICKDALVYLAEQPDRSIDNILTGLPDMDEIPEIGNDIGKYTIFFRTVLDLILKKIKLNGYMIFIQTDRKHDGELFDKSYHCTDEAFKHGAKLIWHKIVLRRDVNKTDIFRPTYSHVLCYTYTGRPQSAFPDVLPIGKKLYSNATPENVSDLCAKYIANVFKTGTVVDPFVGRGTVGKSVLNHGLNFVGIDIDEKQCIATRQYLSTLGSIEKVRPVITLKK